MRAPVELIGDASLDVISSRNFSAYPMAEQYQALSDRSGLDFSATIDFLENLPIFLSGERHKESRRALAKIYADTRPKQMRNVDSALKEISASINSVDGEFDVVRGISQPLWVAVRDAIIENTEIDGELASELPDLFYPSLSIRKRKLLNDRLADVLNSAVDRSKSNTLNVLAILTLGVRPLVHSLTLSMHALAKANNTKRLSAISYPATFIDSSLRFVDRIAEGEGSIQGYPHEAGDRFRCISFDESYSDILNSKLLFGAGAHICLGRPISVYIWQGLTSTLSNIDKKISMGELIWLDQEPFRIVKKCTVGLGENF